MMKLVVNNVDISEKQQRSMMDYYARQYRFALFVQMELWRMFWSVPSTKTLRHAADRIQIEALNVRIREGNEQ